MFKNTLTKEILSPNQIEALRSIGLSVRINHSETTKNPRDVDVKSVWVGVDTPTLAHKIDLGESFDDYVKNYCHEVLDCTPDDIVWSTVYTTHHNNCTSYSLEKSKNEQESYITGFIYRTKDELRKTCDSERIGKKIRELTKLSFKEELESYQDWLNGEVYSISVYSIETGVIIGQADSLYPDDKLNCFVEIMTAIDNILVKNNFEKLEVLVSKLETN